MSVEQAECERLFMAAAPFVRAEHERRARLLTARAEYKGARAAAADARRTWAEFLLAHDHLSICLGRARPGEQPSDTAEGRAGESP